MDICKRYETRGLAGLRTRPSGPEVGTGRALTRPQERQIRRLICRATLDAYGLPYALWSRAAVAALVKQRCGVSLAVRSMGRYLQRWGFTPQKPLRRAYEQNPRKVRRWVCKQYPAIAAKARQAEGKVYWLDESGVRADDVRGRSYAPCGQTPEVRPCQKRASVGVISAVTNEGELRWMVLNGALTAVVLIMFLQRLIRDAGCKVFLIMDRLPVHRAAAVKTWLAQHRSQIKVYYLPADSPEPLSGRGHQRRHQAERHREAARPQAGRTQTQPHLPHAQALEIAQTRAQPLPASNLPLRRLSQEHPGRINNSFCQFPLEKLQFLPVRAVRPLTYCKVRHPAVQFMPKASRPV